MKIGINLLNISPAYKGGTTSFTDGLLRGLSNTGVNKTFQIYIRSKDVHFVSFLKDNPNFEIIIFNHVSLGIRRKIRKILLRFNSLIIDEKIMEILFGNISRKISRLSEVIYTPTTVSFPYCYKIPSVLSIHDIQQVHFPEFFSEQELKLRKITYDLSVKNASFIQASSVFIKEDLQNNYSLVNSTSIKVISEGVNIPVFRKQKKISYLKEKYNFSNKYLFFPAQIWPHKNHITILKALKKIERETGIQICLVLTGAIYEKSEPIFEFIRLNNMDYVHYLGLVSFNDLICLYQNAEYMITGVLYESSSLPILEAAASGTPVIASRTPPNIEMSENLKINMFDPLNTNELSELLLRIWDNQELRKEQVDYNNINIKKYSWDTVALKYIKTFETIKLSTKLC
jgi:glycosyltransferase involved in cell wall biosynthesis